MKKNLEIKSCSNLNLRLQTLLSDKNMSMHTLSKKSGVAIGTIQKMVSKPESNPTITSIESVARALNVPISYLIGEENNALVNTAHLPMPIYDWDQLDAQLNNKKANVDYIASVDDVSAQAFALKMVGNAMQPLFPDGITLIFDPLKSIYDGSFVLVYIKSLQKYLFKELLIDEPDQYIRSINPRFIDKIQKINTKEDKIIATLAQAQHKY